MSELEVVPEEGDLYQDGEFTKPGIDVEALRKQIDVERDARLEAGFTWNDVLWHSDVVFQGQITSRITSWNAGLIEPEETKPVRSKDNQIHDLSFEDHKALAAALIAHVESVYAWSWAAKDAL